LEAAVDSDRPPVEVAGPYFEDLHVGMIAPASPALTLTDGHAAVHQAILGVRLRLALDAELCREVTGRAHPLAHPALVCDVAIGQSTLVTHRVIANLFYRGLAFRRAPALGDTLSTSTEVVSLRQNRRKPGQEGNVVLDFWRCAMLPLRDPEASTGHSDDLSLIAPSLDREALSAPVRDWRLDRLRAAVGSSASTLTPGREWAIEHGDVVSCAPELTRLSLNVATVHHDVASGKDGRRLVYGGHTIGIAAAQATLALPDLVTIVAWHGCDHVNPVYEGDTLTSRLILERLEPLEGRTDGALVHLRSRVQARREGEGDPVEVLDWRFVAVIV
jgi:acyl dehydratase